MSRKIKTYCWCFLSVLFVYACTDRPDGVLPRKAMEDVLYDVYLAQATLQSVPRYASAGAKDTLIAGVMAKHKITQAQFDSSIVWYSRQGEVYYKINDVVSQRLKDFQREITTDESQALKMRKKYDGVTLPSSVTLDAHAGISTFSFTIDSLRFSIVDTAKFDFNFNILGVKPKMNVAAVVLFKYKDTTIVNRVAVNNNSHYSIKRPAPRKNKLENISGYIRVVYPVPVSSPVFVYDLNYKKVLPKPKPVNTGKENGKEKVSDKARPENPKQIPPPPRKVN